VNPNPNALNATKVLATLRRRWYVVVSAGILGAVVAFALSSATTPIYQSTSSLYFALRSGASGSDINQGSTYTQNQMLSFARLATSSTVLGVVIHDLNLDMSETELRQALVVTIPQNTVVLDVQAASPNSRRAADVANGVAEQLAVVVSEIAPTDTEGKPTVVARVIEPAVPAVFQSTPDKKLDTVLGGVLGALLAFLALTLATVFDTRIRSEGALKHVTDRPLLGALSNLQQKLDARPIIIRSPNSPEAEQYRKVRSGLRFAAASHDIKSIAVTSSIPGEGKSTISTNLALTVAETGVRVLLIDADLRRPRIAEYLGVDNAVGLTTVLVNGVTFDDAVHRWGHTSLDVLAAGEIPPNPAELLASAHMKEFIASVSLRYDLIIIDTAPVLSVADATVIAQQADAAVMVADARSVRRTQLSQSFTTLERAGVHIAGVVLNRVRAESRQDLYFYGAAEHERDESKHVSRRPARTVVAAEQRQR
jgi:capsular exopolysaccharide synthesis family protein